MLKTYKFSSIKIDQTQDLKHGGPKKKKLKILKTDGKFRILKSNKLVLEQIEAEIIKRVNFS